MDEDSGQRERRWWSLLKEVLESDQAGRGWTEGKPRF